MSELPFLVVHGAMVWKVLVPGLAAGTLATSAKLRDRAARKRATAVAMLRSGHVRPPDAGPVSLRGKMRGGAVHTLSRRFEHHDDVEGAPWIESEDGARIELDKRATVIAAAHVRSSIIGTPRETPAALHRQARGHGWTLSTVREGDEVLAMGVASRSTEADAGYRDDVIAWRLGPNPAMDAIELAAVAPTARAEPRPPGSVAWRFVALALVWFGVLHWVGSKAIGRIADRGPTTSDSIAPFGALAIAAAMPDSRYAALEAISGGFPEFSGLTRRGSSLDTVDEVADLIGGCKKAQQQLADSRLDAALASARDCGDRELEATIQLFRGDYAAALALTPPDPGARELAAIGAGDWKAAALAADDVAADKRSNPRRIERVPLHARCIAALLHAYAGDREQAPASDVDSAPCQLYAALALPPDPQRTALRAILATQRATRASDYTIKREAATLLAFDRDEPVVPHEIETLTLDAVRGIDWLAALVPADGIDRRPFRYAHAIVALEQADFATARADLAALTSPADAETHSSLDAEEIAYSIAIREGSPLPKDSSDEARSLYAEVAALRDGIVPDEETLGGAYPEDCKPKFRSAVRSALAGDGLPLARVFAECSIYYIAAPRLLFGVLPRVKQHRAELADSLRVFRDRLSTFSFDGFPFQPMSAFADYRDVAWLIGDTQEADRMQAIIKRHAAALTDRRRVIAFTILADR